MLQALISGILVGSVYGLFSMGFSLAFGVMRIVNFAHGELVMIGMFVGLVVANNAGVDPLLAMPLAIVIVGTVSALLYLFVFQRFVGRATHCRQWPTYRQCRYRRPRPWQRRGLCQRWPC